MKTDFYAISMAALLGVLLIDPVTADDNTRIFQNLDVDGDGYISEYEALAHEELPDAFADGDENNDGRIDMIEFLNLEILED